MALLGVRGLKWCTFPKIHRPPQTYYELGEIVHVALAPFQLLLRHFLPLKACFPTDGSLK